MNVVRGTIFALLALLWIAGLNAHAIAAEKASAEPKINVNTASEAELTKLPGIGPAKAKAIVEHRQQSPFKTVDDLKDVRGIGEATVESLRDQVTVGAK